jgi:hypothetical protein
VSCFEIPGTSGFPRRMSGTLPRFTVLGQPAYGVPFAPSVRTTLSPTRYRTVCGAGCRRWTVDSFQRSLAHGVDPHLGLVLVWLGRSARDAGL